MCICAVTLQAPARAAGRASPDEPPVASPAKETAPDDRDPAATSGGDPSNTLEGTGEVDTFEARDRPEASSGARVEIAPMPDPSASSAVGTLSEGGTNRGILELTLGSMVALASVALVANGAYQIAAGVDRRAFCEMSGQVCSLSGDSPTLRFSAAGLSFAFAIPVAVGAGFWLRRGVRVHRDYRAVRTAAGATARRGWVIPFVFPRGMAGLAARVVF